MAAKRYNITFTGHVQGVFFRATAEKIARNFDVAGWVRNEADGSVRMVIEGEQAELDRFISEVRAAKKYNIEDVRIDHDEATGEFTSFGIRH